MIFVFMKLGLLYLLITVASAHASTSDWIIPDENFRKNYCDESRLEKKGLTSGDISKVASFCELEADGTKWLSLVNSFISNQDNTCEGCAVLSLDTLQEVPIGYSSYMAFINPARVGEPAAEDEYVNAVKGHFFLMGEALGEKHVNVWLERIEGGHDSERSRRYCNALGLSYNEGPYLVLSSKRTDMLEKGDEIFYVKLNNINLDRTLILLNEIEQQLLSDDLSETQIIYSEVKQRFLSIIGSTAVTGIVSNLEKVTKILD